MTQMTTGLSIVDGHRVPALFPMGAISNFFFRLPWLMKPPWSSEAAKLNT
jgi:hypothetical protein